MLRSPSSEKLQVRESTDVSGGHKGSPTIDAIQMVLRDRRPKQQTDTERASSSVDKETTSPHEQAEGWANETLVGLRAQFDTMKREFDVLTGEIDEKQKERTKAIDRRSELRDMKGEEEGKYKENVAELEKITGISLVGQNNDAIKETLAQLRREWRPTEKQYERIKKLIKVAEKISGELPINSDERQNETKWKEAGEKAFTIKRLTINIWASIKKLEDIQRQIVVPREITAILPDLKRKCAELGKNIKDIKGEINRLCNSEEMKMENTISNQETLIRNLGIDLQNARHRLRQVRRDIDKDRDEESALNEEVNSKKHREKSIRESVGAMYDQWYRSDFLGSIQRSADTWEHDMHNIEGYMQEVHYIIETVKERRIPVPERANAHPDAMTVEDPGTMRPEEIVEEHARLEKEQSSLKTKIMRNTHAIFERMPDRRTEDHLTYMQNHPENLQACLPFMLEQSDCEKALKKNHERLIRLSDALLVYPSDRSQFIEIHPDFRENQEKLSSLQERFSKLQEGLQAKEKSLAALDEDIKKLDAKLSEENKALETMRKDQKGVKKSIDLIRGSI